jgi:hypothetical protein
VPLEMQATAGTEDAAASAQPECGYSGARDGNVGAGRFEHVGVSPTGSWFIRSTRDRVLVLTYDLAKMLRVQTWVPAGPVRRTKSDGVRNRKGQPGAPTSTYDPEVTFSPRGRPGGSHGQLDIHRSV